MVSQSHIAKQFLDKKSIEAENWSNVTLYQPYEETQILIAENASCLAVKTYLHMVNLDFEIKTRANAEFMSPGGRITKLPFIQAGSFVVSEFEHIVSFVESKGKTLISSLDADEKSDLRAYMSLAENIFSHAEIYISWLDKSVLQVTLSRNGSVFPWPLNYIQNWRKKRQYLQLLQIYNWKNYTIDDVIKKVDKCCETLSMLLGDNDYFYHNTPTELDALVFGHIFTILTTDLPNKSLAQTVSKYPTLLQFCKRIDTIYFKRN